MLYSNGICLLYLNLKLNFKSFEKVFQFPQKINAIIFMMFDLPWVPLLKVDGYNYHQAAQGRTLLEVGRAAEGYGSICTLLPELINLLTILPTPTSTPALFDMNL